ncbi:hypothetical protein I4U23_026791 [Adineta vaga]|nr:hypothetical protein I4U23_026791 [Adineta vaga]
MLTLSLIICRLKFCLRMKNYLFYGKKYGLSQAQRLSTAKMTQRVHSIIVRESQSPSIESMKQKTLIYNIDQLLGEESSPPMNISPDMRISLSCSSILNRNEENESEINRDLNLSRLASEV